MASKVDICNMALAAIGMNPIASMDDGSQQARICGLFFDQVRDDLLQGADWNFARKVEKLNLISGQTMPGYTFLYQQPTRCLFVRRLLDEGGISPERPYEHEELLAPTTGVKAIAANLEEAYVDYTVQVTDTTAFPPAVVTSLFLNLASVLAAPLGCEAALFSAVLKSAQLRTSSAMAFNAQEGYKKPSRVTPYLE